MNEQARLLLSAYRPGGGDANDPAFAEALAQAQRDPQLRAWLEESQSFDRAISEKLRGVAVPADLRSTILAGAKMSRPRGGRAAPQWWALAAAVAILVSLGAWWRMNATRLESWQVDSLAVLDRIEAGVEKLDLEHAQQAHLVDWLRAHAAPAPAAFPPTLATHGALGCKTIDAHGRKVSLICFDLGGHEQAHLFTTPRAGLRIAPPGDHPLFRRRGHWNLASWSSGEAVHMIASQIEEGKLRALLPLPIAAHGLSAPMLLGEIFPRP